MSAASGGASRRNPATLEERRRMQPPRLARGAVDLAVRMLPADHRERYAIEFYADLFGLPKKEQRRQAFGVLLHVQHLAWALGNPAPDLERRPARRRRDLRCVLHLHHYARRHILHPEDGVLFLLECTRCRKPVFLLPGDGLSRKMMALGAFGGDA